MYLERLLPGQLLSGGGAVLLHTIKHPGLRLEEGGGKEEEREEREETVRKDEEQEEEERFELGVNLKTNTEQLAKMNDFKILTNN